MIATRLHIKRHSTSALQRPSTANIRYSSYRQPRRRTSKLASPTNSDVISDISEDSDELLESTQVDVRLFFSLFSYLNCNH